MMFWHGIDLRWAYADLLPSIYRQTFCKHSAHDVLHDALVRFALSKNPSREQQPHAYLQIIVRNLLIDNYHHQNRYVQLPEELQERIEDNLNEHDASVAFHPSAEHMADINQRIQALQALVEHLPGRCREVFWLFKIEGMRQEAIATQLGISQNMVEKHMITAMKKLLAAKDLIA